MDENSSYICMISVHGLIRGSDLELGRDADTGGQTRYVVELAQALGDRADVERVDLLTRRIEDPNVAADYAKPIEPIGKDARIVRVDAGPGDYIRKELLWEHLDEFVDNAEKHLRDQPRLPDVIHAHYADAGWVGAKLSERLEVPLVFTGHSLGRVKRERLLANGLAGNAIEQQYKISQRIEAEEEALRQATFVVASTSQEVEEQYGMYENGDAESKFVIPPGTDLDCFYPGPVDEDGAVAEELRRFLTDIRRPIVLVLARPDPRKNLIAHVEAFAANPELPERANLVVIAGTRDDIEEMEGETEDVLTELLVSIDRHDLYGKVAYPKDFSGDDIPTLYRLAAASRGVHVNAALTEPFGLTLIEAAACGLPVVATEDGGPRDIIERCRHGVLVDPLDPEKIAEGIASVLFDDERWDEMSRAGIAGVEQHFSWEAHARHFVETLRDRLPARSARAKQEPA